MQRVRIVRPPLTDYQRRQFDWGYPGNLRAGEDTRVLDGTRADELGLPDWDFWLFDDEAVLQMNYEADGTFVGREILSTPTRRSSAATASSHCTMPPCSGPTAR